MTLEVQLHGLLHIHALQLYWKENVGAKLGPGPEAAVLVTPAPSEMVCLFPFSVQHPGLFSHVETTSPRVLIQHPFAHLHCPV